jgi:hypothetical protein
VQKVEARHAEINVMGLTVAVGELKNGTVESAVFSGSGRQLGAVQTAK